MNGAFYIGAVGLDAQQRALEVVANNIANINTTAFKRSSVQFSELVGASRDSDDLAVRLKGPAGLAGVVLAGTPQIFTQGTLQRTGQQYDLAINGDGFLELEGSSGRTMLWRGGTMKVNSDGLLCATDGTPLKAMITVPQGSNINIDSDGTVSALANDGTSQQIGQLDLVLAKSSDDLVETSGGYYEASDASALSTVKPGDEGGVLVQGSLEASNVQLADEMTNLLLMQRAFGASAQVVQAGDQLMGIVNTLRRA